MDNNKFVLLGLFWGTILGAIILLISGNMFALPIGMGIGSALGLVLRQIKANRPIKDDFTNIGNSNREAATDISGERVDVELVEVGSSVIEVIKAVRESNPSLGLKDAKDIVDNVPSIVGEQVTREEAETIKARFEATGAKVNVR